VSPGPAPDDLSTPGPAQQLARLEALFDLVLGVPAEEQAARLAQLCGEDTGLRAEVQGLLDAHQAEVASSRERRLAQQAAAAPAGKRIGPYLLESLLGRGGMGAVYLAHRADGQYEKKVAIKLIDLPLAGELLRDRFLKERQILAGLEHPNIARMLEGGVSDDGEPYLVMEYVRGRPIHAFCASQGLPLEQRLELFRRVCEAVQFAHQNLVVHRDLKPDNILVDEAGAPHLLDFGTATLLSPDGAERRGELTRQGFLSFTPQYASPEQVLGKPITTASDTYSLGVLLYLVLTGTLPYEVKDLSTEGLIRVICEQPPRRPVPAPGLGKRLASDLEAILAKALRKEPEARYRTAEQLGNDVQAYLDRRPVSAHRGTLRYRVLKFVRRNAMVVGAAGLLVASLVAGLSAVLFEARQVDQQRRVAEARSADLRQLSNSLLSELDEAIKQLPGSTGAQKLLVTRVLEHLDRLARDTQGDRLTQLDLADAYLRLGNLQGNPYDQNLGDAVGGLASLDKALGVVGPLAERAGDDPVVLRSLALAEQSRSEILFGMQRTQEAVASMRAATRAYDRLAAGPGTSAALLSEAAAAYGSLGDELGQGGTGSLGDPQAALAAYRRDIELNQRALAADPTLLRARRGQAVMQVKIGNLELDVDPAQALLDYQLGLDRFEALPAAEREALTTRRLHLTALRKRATAQRELGAYAEAIAGFEAAARGFRELAGADPQDLRALFDLQIVLETRAEAYQDWADPRLGGQDPERPAHLAAAAEGLEQADALLERMLQHDPDNITWRLSRALHRISLGTLHRALGRGDDPLPATRAALAELVRLAESAQASAQVLDGAAWALFTVEPAGLREPRLGVTYAQREVEASHRQTPFRLLTLAQAYRAAGQAAQARAAAGEGLALLPALAPGAVKPRLRRLLELEVAP
jgi:eukaryotic-like serine/threonine-protein kinase